MAQNAADVRIAIKGKVLTAPLGSTAPVDVTTAWGAAWTDHGYTDTNGVKITPKVTAYDVKAWQSDTAIRSRIMERIREVQFVLLQTGGLNTQLYEGGGGWTSLPTRTVADGVLNGTTTVTSATAAFVPGDVGGSISGPGIPAGAYITARASGTSVTISAAATITATGVSLVIGSAGVSMYTPPLPGTDDTRMLGLEFVDGTITKRIVHPTSIAIAVGQIEEKAGQEARYDVTMRILGDTWYELSNDPADQPATLAA